MFGLKSIFGRLLANCRGNFSAAVAALAPVLLLAGAIGTDFTTGMTLKSRLADAVDAAAAAAAASKLEDGLSDDAAKDLAHTYLIAQLESDGFSLNRLTLTPKIDVKTTADPSGREVYKISITADAKFNTNGVTAAVFSPTLDVSASSHAESAPESFASISMFLVLDKSGSMAWDGKMDALKLSVGKLMAKLEQAQDEAKALAAAKKAKKAKKASRKAKRQERKNRARSGAIAYDSYVTKPELIDWGTQQTTAYTNGLVAGGGTDSSGAMKEALKYVSAFKEKKSHEDENGVSPKRYIVFMTDGENNSKQADKKTRRTCKKAKKKGIIVYSVAFKAPQRGQKLLQDCATDADHYFDAQSTEELINAFEQIALEASSKMARITN